MNTHVKIIVVGYQSIGNPKFGAKYAKSIFKNMKKNNEILVGSQIPAENISKCKNRYKAHTQSGRADGIAKYTKGYEDAGNGIIFSPADAATRELKENQWAKLEKATIDYVNDPKNTDRMIKAAQAGIDSYPNSNHRTPEMVKVRDILKEHKAKGTCPC